MGGTAANSKADTARAFNSERKRSTKSILSAISLALAFVSPAFAGIEWGFSGPDLSVNASGGAGTAKINVGAFNTGFHSGSTLPWTLGSAPGAMGFWDLGRNGSIMLQGLSGNGPVTLNVFQWVDSGVNNGPYSGELTFTASNGSRGTLAAVNEVASSGLTGAWWEYAASLGALTSSDTITISAGSGGAIIDHLTLVPEPATMIAGAVLLIPLALSTWPILRRRRTTRE